VEKDPDDPLFESARRALCAFGETERQKDHAGDKFMRYRFNRGYRYRLTNPPKAILNARLDNIAIVPASMLPLTPLLKESESSNAVTVN
jgi:hypothetical protein